MMMMRARTFATVETTCRMAPHLTFMQFTKVRTPEREREREKEREGKRGEEKVEIPVVA